MATVTEVRKVCDLCGYGGAFSAPVDFKSFAGDVDLCIWCCHPKESAGNTLSSGGHTVTFTDDAWTCDCGTVYRKPFISPRVLNVVPDLPAAVAINHVHHAERSRS